MLSLSVRRITLVSCLAVFTSLRLFAFEISFEADSETEARTFCTELLYSSATLRVSRHTKPIRQRERFIEVTYYRAVCDNPSWDSDKALRELVRTFVKLEQDPSVLKIIIATLSAHKDTELNSADLDTLVSAALRLANTSLSEGLNRYLSQYGSALFPLLKNRILDSNHYARYVATRLLADAAWMDQRTLPGLLPEIKRSYQAMLESNQSVLNREYWLSAKINLVRTLALMQPQVIPPEGDALLRDLADAILRDLTDPRLSEERPDARNRTNLGESAQKMFAYWGVFSLPFLEKTVRQYGGGPFHNNHSYVLEAAADLGDDAVGLLPLLKELAAEAEASQDLRILASLNAAIARIERGSIELCAPIVAK